MDRVRLVGCILAVLTALPFWAEAQKGWRGMNVSSSITEQDLRDLNEYSVNVVRYQLSWGLAADNATEAQYRSWLTGELARFDALAPVFRAAQIKVILDLHTPPGGFVTHSPPKPKMRIFEEAWAQAAVVSIWRELAARYKDSDVIAAYQPVSEPAAGTRPAAGLKNWYKLQLELGAAIRESDTKRPIIVTSEYSNPNNFKKIKWPKKLKRAIYCLNFYLPTNYLRQGVELPANTTDYPMKKYGKKQIEKSLAKAREFQEKNKATMYVSEFTTSRFGPKGSDVRYLKDVLSLFEKYRWLWTYHAWREALVWSIEHDGPDPNDPTKSPTRTARAAYLETFFAKNRPIP